MDILEDAPPLFLELQDQITRSRIREAFWISLVVHLFAVVALVNTPKLLDRGRPVVVLNARDLMHDKELTYLELPPDEQKVTKRPDTNIISDKNRSAASKNPTIDRKTLQQLRDSARPGTPGHGVPSRPAPPSPPANAQGQAAPSQATTAQQQPGQSGSFPAPQNTQTQAKLEQPPIAGSAGKGAFKFPTSAGSAIDQATRAAAATRGGFGGGSGGDYGVGIPRGKTQVQSQVDILSDTMGVDFGPYLSRVLHDVRLNWYNLIPEAARPPLLKQGKVSIEFFIMKDGSVQSLHIVTPSGDISLDRAAYGGITASDPFPPLPNGFGGQFLALRFHFYYNPSRSDLQ